MQADQAFEKPYTDDWDEPQPARASRPHEQPQPHPPEVQGEESASATSVANIQRMSDNEELPRAPREKAPAPAAKTPQVVACPIPEVAEDRYPALAQRSALFRVGRAEEVVSAEEIACYEKEREIILSGPRPNMDDKRVWEAALRAAKQRKIAAGAEFRLSARGIAKAIFGREATGAECQRVGKSLLRLASAEIDYKLPSGVKGKAKLLGCARKEPAGWMVSIDPGLVPALDDDKQFKIEIERREKLSTDLARWLHDFFSTHKEAAKTAKKEGAKREFDGSFRIARLASLCGAKDDLSHFPSKLSRALAELADKCPELVASFNLRKPAREWERWEVVVDRGSENALFTWPAEQERKERAKREAKAAQEAKKKKRGGVAL